MADNPVALSKRRASQLKRMLDSNNSAGQRIGAPDQQSWEIALCKANADIAPFGNGVATIWRYDPDTSAFAVTSTTDRAVYDWLGLGAKSGERYVIVRSPHFEGCKWILLRDAGTATPIRFELSATLSLGGSANAQEVNWDGAAYTAAGATITVRDFTASPGTWRGLTGYRGWAIAMPDRADYEIIWMETTARSIEFTLTGGMSGGSATATVDDSYLGKAPTIESVFDTQGLFTWALSGAKGLARYDDETDQYEIVECQSKAGYVFATLTEVFAAGVSDDATKLSHGGTQQDIQSPGSTVTVLDPNGLFTAAVVGDKFFCVLDPASGNYNAAMKVSHAPIESWFGTGGTTSISGTSDTVIALSQVVRTSANLSASGSGVELGKAGVYLCSFKVNGVPNAATSPFTYMLNAKALLDGTIIPGSLASTKWEIFSAGGLDTNKESVSATVLFAATAGQVVTLAAANGSSLADFDAIDGALTVQYQGPAVA